MGTPAVEWRIDGGSAVLRCGPLSAIAHCSLIPTQWHQTAIDDVSVLGSGGPHDHLVEPYIRGGDFVASYVRHQQQHIAPQVYWRARFDEVRGAAQVEFVLSVQTDLLDSRPEFQVGSCVMNAQLFRASRLDAAPWEAFTTGALGREIAAGESRENLFVYRRNDRRFSYAEMVHPTDFISAAASLDGQQPMMVSYRLFPERLEKGVIRRARVCGWFLPAEHDLAMAVELARQFVAEPLPLTT